MSSPIWRLGKFNVVQHWWPPLLGALWVVSDSGLLVGFAVGMLSTVSFAFIVALTSTLDDITGLKDGSDWCNYGVDDPRRVLSKKPLLTGEVSVPFAYWLSGLWLVCSGVAFWLAIIAAGSKADPWVSGAWVVCAVLGAFYSWGIKWTHWPFGGEFCICVTTILSALWPMWLAGLPVGSMVPFAVLLGVAFVAISAYSNLNDVAADSTIGRKNAATMGGECLTFALLACLWCAAAAVALWFAIVRGELGAVPVALLLGVLFWRQARVHRAGNVLDARRMGLRNYNIVSVAMVCVIGAEMLVTTLVTT
ncbi:hypothetical protein [Kocuria palustris]|uniref:hypothetical protein n=1 Tax=Kocuria palustris TaxID=71999 RepID=UPI003CF18D0E